MSQEYPRHGNVYYKLTEPQTDSALTEIECGFKTELPRIIAMLLLAGKHSAIEGFSGERGLKDMEDLGKKEEDVQRSGAFTYVSHTETGPKGQKYGVFDHVTLKVSLTPKELHDVLERGAEVMKALESSVTRGREGEFRPISISTEVPDKISWVKERNDAPVQAYTVGLSLYETLDLKRGESKGGRADTNNMVALAESMETAGIKAGVYGRDYLTLAIFTESGVDTLAKLEGFAKGRETGKAPAVDPTADLKVPGRPVTELGIVRVDNK